MQEVMRETAGWSELVFSPGLTAIIQFGWDTTAFSRLEQSHVISMIHAENQPSIRVAQRLRMRLEGQTALMDHPVLVYGIRRPAARSPGR